MGLRKVPPCLPAVFQLGGYGLNLPREKDELPNDTAMVHTKPRRRRDSYLGHLKQGVKSGSFSSVCEAPLNPLVLFMDGATKTKEDSAKYKLSRHTSNPHLGPGRFTTGKRK